MLFHLPIRSRATLRKVFVYKDSEGASRIWQDNFIRILKGKRIPFVKLPFDGWFGRPKSTTILLGRIRRYYQEGDIFLSRFNERKEKPIKALYPELVSIFGTQFIFPDLLAVQLYNNKQMQADWFNGTSYPTPRQCWVEEPADLKRFMGDHGLTFPIVRKASSGAASVGVSLLSDPNTTYPFVAQEFCARNEGDLRIMVVGDKVFGFARKNRENDFRASGSGVIDYIDELPMDCVKLAYRISRDSGFRCMAYDFIRNNESQWVVAEISYTFVSDPPARCNYYYSANEEFARKNESVESVERLIIEDMYSRNFG